MKNIVEKLFVFIWTVWGFLIFSLVLIVSFPVFFVMISTGNKKVIRWAHSLPRIAAQCSLFFFGIRTREAGRERFSQKKQYIFIGNHNSNLDPVIFPGLIPNFVKFLAKAEILDMPIFGFVVRSIYVSVQRDDREDRRRSMSIMHGLLHERASVVLLPEGTRNRTPDVLGPFHDGAFKLSIQTGIPIMMLTAVNSFQLMKPTNWWLRPGLLHAVWTGPYYPENLELIPEDIEKYKHRLRNEMIKVIKQAGYA